MSDIAGSATTAREQARQDDGKFGAQQLAVSDDIVLAEAPRIDRALGDVRGLTDEWSDVVVVSAILENLEDPYYEIEHENVAYLVLEAYEGSEDRYYSATGYDAEGYEIDGAGFECSGGLFRHSEVPTAFVPNHASADQTPPGDLPTYQPWQGILTIDLAKARAFDYGRYERDTLTAITDLTSKALVAGEKER